MDADAVPATTRPTSDLPQETLDYFGGDDLRARVLFDKYALRDPEGRVLETTPPQMWKRIAREIASVEPTAARQAEWEEKFYWLLDDFRFIPGGRIMHGAGNPKRVTLLNCFPAGTPVLTKRGFVPIQHVLPGDEVLTHHDRFKLVTHVMEREADEPLVELSFFYLGDQPIRCTPNHRFHALEGSGRPKWVRADELTSAHYVKVDRISETIPLTKLDVLDYLDGGALEEDDEVYTAMPFVGGNGAVAVRESRRMKRVVTLDERFGRWLGYLVAEGGVTLNSVYFTLSKDEPHLAREIATLTQDLFGLEAAVQHRTDQSRHWMRVYIHSKVLVRFLRGFFGNRTAATDKRLPEWFLRLPSQVQRAFVGAVFAGDGVIQNREVKLFLANPDLMRQIYTLLLRLNIVASIRWEGILRYTKRRGMWITVGTQRYVEAIKAWINGNVAFESTLGEAPKHLLHKILDGNLFVKVKRTARLDAPAQTLFDLTVEDDHSFTVGWLGTHNCYVLPVHDDSIESIFEWMKEAARTYSLGGGVGTDISILRPRGAPVNNAARSSTGSVSFMELFSLTTGTIGQSGRRGALMITIADTHPDVLDFVRVKRNLTKVRYANISVRVSDRFMQAVESDGEFALQFSNERAAWHQTIRARELWNELIKGARDYAEPGLIFWDHIKTWSTSEYNGMGVITTNPCSEIPLEPYGNCCLGNVNMARFVSNPFGPQPRVDWEHLEPALRTATRFLDNVLDYNADKHPLPAQRSASLKSRRIGVGFTGLGDMLIKLGLKYDTEEAVGFTDQLFDRIKNVVYDESVNLACEKGVFPAYDADKHLGGRFVATLQPQVLERIRRHGLRNVALLTVPPVGSGAALAGVTSGIEPIFDVAYVRRSESLSQDTFKVYHPLVREYMARFEVEREDDLPPFFVTAHQIKPEMRVKMQAAIQKHIDHSISSTVNLPRESTPEEVERVYFLAWKLGCKGITVYRAGSRENILTAMSEIKKEKASIYAAPRGILEDFYHNQRKSLSEIAQLYGTNVGTVHRVFTRLDIERRKPIEAADEIATKSIQLSETLVELVEGELLGDGSLRRYKNGAAFTYTTKHYDYAVWLVGQLERGGIECSDIVEHQHDVGNIVFKFQTLAYKELGDLHDRWYNPQGNKRLPTDFVLTPIRLRQWFIGDGSNVTDSKAKYIACYSSFSEEDKRLLKIMLEKVLGRSLIFHESSNKIYINADAVKTLFDVIGPCPVTCYEYKWKGGEHVMYVREPGIAQLEESPVTGSEGGHTVASPAIQGDAPRATQSAHTTPRPRPKVTSGRTERVETPRGRIYVVVNEDEWGVCEVFVHSLDVEAEGVGRLASLALRGRIDPREVIEQLWRVQSKEVAFDRSGSGTVVRVTTIAQAVALALGRALYGEDFRPDKEFPRADVLPEPVNHVRQQTLKFAPDAGVATGSAPIPEVGIERPGNGETAGNGDHSIRLEFIGICPDCGAQLVHENGCAHCQSCGYSKC